jgi:hypothetical protein
MMSGKQAREVRKAEHQYRVARGELRRMLVTLHTIHDHMHAQRFDAAHEAVHRYEGGGEVHPENVCMDDAALVAVFSQRFNALCRELRLNAAYIVPCASISKEGYVSVQIGGHVPTIQFVRAQMGLARAPIELGAVGEPGKPWPDSTPDPGATTQGTTTAPSLSSTDQACIDLMGATFDDPETR